MSEEQIETIDTRAEFAAAALSVVESARYLLRIGSQRLEKNLYGSSEFASTMQRFALSSPKTEIRLLVREPRDALHESPILIQLARKMRSRFAMRQPANQHGEFDDEWILSDEGFYFHRRLPDDRQATLAANALFETRKQITEFDALWEAAVPSSELRELGI